MWRQGDGINLTQMQSVRPHTLSFTTKTDSQPTEMIEHTLRRCDCDSIVLQDGAQLKGLQTTSEPRAVYDNIRHNHHQRISTLTHLCQGSTRHRVRYV